MNPTTREYFRQILRARWNSLMSMNNPRVKYKTIEIERLPDAMDMAALKSEQNVGIILIERKNEKLDQIRDALERLDSGRYGICEDCGRSIAIKRLKVRPEARSCVGCTRKKELGFKNNWKTVWKD